MKKGILFGVIFLLLAQVFFALPMSVEQAQYFASYSPVVVAEGPPAESFVGTYYALQSQQPGSEGSIVAQAQAVLSPAEFSRFKVLAGLDKSVSSGSEEKDPYKDLLGKIDQGLVQTQGSKAGIFNGVTKACFEYGQCTACDILIVFIEISNIILSLFAILALVFFVYGAGYLMFSSGNEQMVSKGKSAIVATVVGSVIVLVAWQLMAYITIIIANGNVFNDKEQINPANPVSGWYHVANRCLISQSQLDKTNNQADGVSDAVNDAFDSFGL